MQFSRRAFLGAGAAALVSGCGRSAPAARSLGADWRGDAMAALTGAAAENIENGSAAGIVLGMSEGSEHRIAAFGRARLDPPVAMLEASVFRIASVTKPIVAALTLKLVDEGSLSLDMTIDRFFPDFPNAERIDIEQLLVHTSGIPNWWDLLPDDTPEDFLVGGEAHRWFARMQRTSDFSPGTMRYYSNSGYVLLGEIIERVTGEPVEATLQSRIFDPAGMVETSMERMASDADHWALGTVADNGDIALAAPTPLPFTAGGLRSTVPDLLNFSDALFGGKLLSPPLLAQMTAHQRTDNGTPVGDAEYVPPGGSPEPPPPGGSEMGYGYGLNVWKQYGETFYSHGGLINGYSAYFIHAPRTATTFAYLSNTQGGGGPLNQLFRDYAIAAA